MNLRPVNLWPWLALSLLLGVAGCTWTIHPPAERPPDAVPVFLADYGGWHSSVLLPTGKAKGQYIEYVVGDWGYAAQGRTSPFDALGALLASNQTALGRRVVTLDLIDPHIDNAGVKGKLVRIDVSRARVDALLKLMDQRYARGTDGTHSPWNDQTYVKVPGHYSWANSCNTLTRDNVERLGCTVSGSAVLGNFKVEPVPGVSTGSWLPPVGDPPADADASGNASGNAENPPATQSTCSPSAQASARGK